MDALIEAADKWLATPDCQRSAAVRDCLLSRLKEASRKQNWPIEERAATAKRIALLEMTTRLVLGFPCCSASG